MAIKIIKDIFLCTLTVVLFFNVLYAEEHIIKGNIEGKYQSVKLNFKKSEAEQAYKKWKTLSTGSYTYICRPNSFMGRNVKAILAVKNNKILLRLLLASQNFKTSISYLDFNSIKNLSLKTRRDRGILRSHLNCNIDKIFNEILNGYYENSMFVNSKISIKYDKRYGYISDLELKQIPNKIYHRDQHSFDIHINSLLMLPKNVKYTDETLKIILYKYKQTWNCEKGINNIKKTNNPQYQIGIKKYIIKKCSEKYLKWDDNVSN